ncbi:hypothetical protein [Pseudomonas sp. OV226]|uniref:hypothetical protein n=1 Tax=Pseudomonas sp. OV226 TaxID=2135588 RepID=UPI000D6B1251|nr:hypothetical protein [Pseudomonas sp. OV226]PWK31759.1 hypothetical protein C7534_12218 [Pseudomonas sp. OV226]
MAGEPISEQSAFDIETIVKLLEGQIAQHYDAYRMRSRWPIILNKANPEDVAEALVRVLSHGRYVTREQRSIVTNITITCSGGDPVAIADAVAKTAIAGYP